MILTIEVWPRSFAWTSLLSVGITPENCMMIQQEHCEIWVTVRQMDRRMDGQIERCTGPFSINRVAWSQMYSNFYFLPLRKWHWQHSRLSDKMKSLYLFLVFSVHESWWYESLALSNATFSHLHHTDLLSIGLRHQRESFTHWDKHIII